MGRDFKGVWIPKDIWLNTDLTMLEKVIFIEIDSLDNENHCTAGNEYFAEFCNCSESKVSKAIKKLKELNMIEEVSFDGRHRKIRVIKNVMQSSKKCYAEQQNLLSNNINNKQENNKVLSKDNTSNFQFGKQKPKKENLYSKCVSLILAKTDSYELRQLLVSWLDMLLEKHKARGKQLYVNVFKGKLNMLDKYDVKDWKEIIEYNLQKGYEGFYSIPQYNNSGAMKRIERMEHVESMTEDDYKELEKLTEERRKNGLRTSF